MHKKESYKHILPHFQLPGQAYFVTWCLKESIPAKEVKKYSIELELLKMQKEFAEKHRSNNLDEIKRQIYNTRKKYYKALDAGLNTVKNPKINLSKQENFLILKEALEFWHGKKLENYAWCIMPNHVHWVFRVYEEDHVEKPVYLQDIMHSVKRFSANKINKLNNREGPLWQKESFDTTIRNDNHLYNVVEYTLNNPVQAGLVRNREDWIGSFGCSGF